MASFSYSDAQLAELVSEFNNPGVREAVELSSLSEILKDARYFIDVGANAGLYTFHAAKHLRDARILAIEANPYLTPLLRRTVEDLRTHERLGNEYEVIAAAVSDNAGSVDFYISKFPTLSSVFPREIACTVKVPTVRLDDFYRASGPTVIKIDIEGGEYRAVRTASQFLRSKGASFFVELHGWGDRTIAKYPIHLWWLFLRNGYASRKIGTHYFFYRASLRKRAASFFTHGPYLGLKYLAVRYAAGFRPVIDKLRNRLRSA